MKERLICKECKQDFQIKNIINLAEDVTLVVINNNLKGKKD